MTIELKWNEGNRNAHAIRNGINAPPTIADPSYGWFNNGSLTCGFARRILSRSTHADAGDLMSYETKSDYYN